MSAHACVSAVGKAKLRAYHSDGRILHRHLLDRTHEGLSPGPSRFVYSQIGLAAKSATVSDSLGFRPM